MLARRKYDRTMRIARVGNAGQEKPAVVSTDEYILVDSLIDD